MDHPGKHTTRLESGLSEVESAIIIDNNESQSFENGLQTADTSDSNVINKPARQRSSGLRAVDTSSQASTSGQANREISREYSGIAEFDAPAPAQEEVPDGIFLEDERREEIIEEETTPTHLTKKDWQGLITTYCWLIFFSIWGALARIGISSITTYRGSPLSGVIWANFSGCFIMGFMAEEIRFFAAVPIDEGDHGKYSSGLKRDKHWNIGKKAIPLYIGITTGFCGSFTSFSTWMRDVFWALSYPPGIFGSRYKGYNVEAVLAELIATTALSIAGLKSGAHLAIFLRPCIPTMPRNFRPHLDALGLFLGPACWIGAVVMSILIPRWRAKGLFASVFAPVGTLIRFSVSRKLNPKIPSFPLGTFSVNVGGSMIDALILIFQNYTHTPYIACGVLRGLEDGLCGCLTTVSTWAVEITTLRRGHAYKYGILSIICSMVSFIVILGTFTWNHGLTGTQC